MNGERDFSSVVAVGLAGDVVRRFGAVRLRAFGTSMVPAILPGDLVSIERAEMHEVLPGEVVLFMQRDRLFIHRVVQQSVASTHVDSGEPCIITRGDRLPQNDPPVNIGELLGRVVSIQRGTKLVKISTHTKRSQQWIARFFQASERGTYLYLRLASFWQSLGRASCRV